VRASSVTFGRAAATLSVRSAKLLADIAELELFEAMGSGQLVVDATDGKPRFSLKAKLPRGDLGKVVEAFSGLRGIQGQGDVSIDFAASGETLQDILHTISGKAGLAMNEGGRLGIDLKSLTKAAQNRPITGWSHALRATTPIENLIARLTLSDGAVYADAVNAMTPDGIVTATGGGNLRTGLVDLKVKIGTPNATERELKALALEAAPDQISVKGPWSAPTIRSETPKSPPPTTPEK